MIVKKDGNFWWVRGEHGVHIVMLFHNIFVCSCVGWERNNMCKHVKEVLEYEGKD